MSFELNPEGLSDFTVDQLKELRASILEKAGSLKEKDDPSAEDLAFVTEAVEAVIGLNRRIRKAEIAEQLSALDGEATTEVEETPETVVDSQVEEVLANEDPVETEEVKETSEPAEEVAPEEETEELAVEETQEPVAEAELEVEEVPEPAVEEAPVATEEPVVEESTPEVVEEEVEAPAEEVEAEEALAIEEVEEAPAEEVEAPVEETEDGETEEVEALSVEEEIAEPVETEEEVEAELANEETTTNESDTKESQEMSTIDGAANAPGFSVPVVESTTPVKAAAGSTTKQIGDKYNDIGELSQEIVASWKRYGGESRWTGLARGGFSDTVMFASVQPNLDHLPTLTSMNEAANTLALNEAVRVHAQEAKDNVLVASGGLCAPLNVDYNFYRLAQPQSPVEAFLPRVAAPRGGLKWLNTPDFTDARAAITIVTAQQDYVGYESTPEECLNSTETTPGAGDWNPALTPDKPCICVECPATSSATVSAIPYCVRWGNFNYYTFPELVENFMLDLMVNYSKVKEVFYLDAINGASVAATSAHGNVGAVRDILGDLRVAAINYRKRHNMSRNATLQLLIPDWTIDMLKQDLLMNHESGQNFLTVSDAFIEDAFRALNLQVATYYDSPTSAGQGFNDAQGAAALNGWPTNVVSYLFAPGTFVRMEGGSLDFGIVRDSTLIATNDLIIAAEQFTGVAKTGFESIKITHTVTVNGKGYAGLTS